MFTIRQKDMLEELLTVNSYIPLSHFTEKHNLSLRSIRQDLIAIEEWLISKHIVLERHRKYGARLVVDKEEQELIHDHLKEESYFLNVKERQLHLIIMILTGEGALNQLLNKFQISQNTLENDIIELRKFIHGYHLTLIRESHVYDIHGHEIYKRHLLVDTLSKLLNEEKMLEMIINSQCQDVSTNHILDTYFPFVQFQELIKIIHEIEGKMEAHFSDSNIYYLFIVLLVQQTRLHYGNNVGVEWFESQFGLTNTSEYAVTKDIFKKNPYFYNVVTDHRTEILYVVMYLVSVHKNMDERHYWFFELAEQIVADFEKRAEVSLKQKYKICEGIAYHLKPALHRLKYGLTIENPLLDDLKTEFPSYFSVLKQMMEGTYSGYFPGIDEDEIGYLLIHLCSGIDTNYISPKKKIAIVCSSGQGTSRLLETSIINKFPEVLVHGPYSVFDLPHLSKENTDLILSTVNIKDTDIPWLKVTPFINQAETNKLEAFLGPARQSVIDESEIMNTVQSLCNIVKKHDVNVDEKELSKDFFRFFKGYQEKSSPVTALTDPSAMLLHQAPESWESAIYMLNDLLVTLKCTSKSYGYEVVDFIHRNDHHFLIADGVVLPHLKSEHVKKTGFSFMTCDEPVLFGPNRDPVKWIILLGAYDHTSHLPAMEMLIEVINSPKLMAKLLEITDPDDIWRWMMEQGGVTP